MPRFRKKPLVIEAFQMTAENRESDTEWPEWLQTAWHKDINDVGCVWPVAGLFQVNTLEGPLTIAVDDWIIQGVKGELYPCKPDIFAATYEAVE